MLKIIWRIIAPCFWGSRRRISFPAGMLTNVSYNYVFYDSTEHQEKGRTRSLRRFADAKRPVGLLLS